MYEYDPSRRHYYFHPDAGDSTGHLDHMTRREKFMSIKGLPITEYRKISLEARIWERIAEMKKNEKFEYYTSDNYGVISTVCAVCRLPLQLKK